MLDVATLSGAEDFMQVQAETQEVYQIHSNNSMLPDFDRTPLRMNHQQDGGMARSPYTGVLTPLVRDYMHADYEKRPSATQLKSQTHTQLTRCRDTLDSSDVLSVHNKDLYYRNNDINFFPAK